MKRLIIAILILLALTSLTYADQTCYVSEPCTFTTVTYNTSKAYYNGSVNNSLIDEEGNSLYTNEAMINIEEGRYVYNYTFNQSGIYLRESKALSTIMNEQITVKDIDETTLAGLIMSNWIWIVIVLILIIIVIIDRLIKRN